MNVIEAKKLMAVMMVSYSNYKPTDINFTAKVWSEMLSEYDYQIVDKALRAYILADTSGFAPSIGQIVEKIKLITEPEALSGTEAWALVRKALSNGYYGAQEEFDALPETVRKAVGSTENLRNWSNIDESSVETVIQSQFLRSYRTEVLRKKEVSKLPEKIRKQIESVNLALEQKNEQKAINVSTYLQNGEQEANTGATDTSETLEVISEKLKALKAVLMRG